MFVSHCLTLGRALALGAALCGAGLAHPAAVAGETGPDSAAALPRSTAPPPHAPDTTRSELGEARSGEPSIITDMDQDLLANPLLRAALEPPSHGAIAPDRLQHASFSFAAGLAIGLVSERPAAAGGGAAALGVGKELMDDRFDVGDLVADLLGAALAALATHALRR